jgi:hypothetical protein
LVAGESNEFRRGKVATNASYLSPDCQNALVEAGARCILAAKSKDVMTVGTEVNALIIDCCTDMVSDNLLVCIRCVAMDTGTILERFIQFAKLSVNELYASSLTEKILAILQQGSRFSVLVEACVAQASGRASVKGGKENGVQRDSKGQGSGPLHFCPLLCAQV